MRSLPIEKKEGFWRAVARILGNFDDALNMTEASLLEHRVARPERVVRQLQAQRPGSSCTSSANQRQPAAKTTSPTTTTGRGPSRWIRRPATSREVSGTRRGPGAIANPVFRADQPQTPCSQRTSDSSMPLKAMEKGAITSEAPVKLRMRNRSGSTNGLRARRQGTTHIANKRTPP